VRNGQSEDFIDRYLELTEYLPTHRIYRLWGALALLAGATQRRIWTEYDGKVLWSNLFIVLVGRPTAKKSNALDPVKRLYSRTRRTNGKPAFHMVPDNITGPAMIKFVGEKAKEQDPLETGELLEYSPVVWPVDEFADFCPKDDSAFMSELCTLYNSAEEYAQGRIIRGDILLRAPILTAIIAAQPATLESILGSLAWDQGFCSRLIMVHADRMESRYPFIPIPKNTELNLMPELAAIRELYGQYFPSQAFKDDFWRWKQEGFLPRPEHTKLVNYVDRREIYFMKLAMLSAVSRGSKIALETFDLDRARDWLLEAEALMPHIFDAMGMAGSDQKVLLEVHRQLIIQYRRTKLGFREAKVRAALNRFIHSSQVLAAWTSMKDQELFRLDHSGYYVPVELEEDGPTV